MKKDILYFLIFYFIVSIICILWEQFIFGIEFKLDDFIMLHISYLENYINMWLNYIEDNYVIVILLIFDILTIITAFWLDF